MNKELQDKIYSMSNSFLPLDVFFNDIRDNPVENYNKEQAYKDIEIIADFIIDLQSQLDQQKAMWNELKEWVKKAFLRNENNPMSRNDYENVLTIIKDLEQGENNVKD